MKNELTCAAPFVLDDIPTSQFVLAGTTLVLQVDVGGTAPINYQWQKNGVNLTDGGRITGSRSNILTIAFATPGDSGNYQLLASNSIPPAASSSVDVITVIPDVSFRGTGTGWTPNGHGIFNGNNVLQLTFNVGNTVSSAFFSTPVSIDGFTASFVYQDATPNAAPGAGGADGIAFCLQNDSRGATAIGGGGGSLGVSGITPSAEFEMNIYNPNTPGVSVQLNGANGGYQRTPPVNIDSGHPIQVVANYTPASGVLAVSLTDLSIGGVFTTNYNVGDLSALVGGHTAYVGFTGADGGVASIQTISNFVYLPPVPSLTAQLAAPNSLLLSWPAASGGYSLQSTAALTNSGPSAWTTVTNNVNFTNGINSVTVSPVTGNKFYRLSLQLQ
jgi:Bacterial lectin/Immunoglobulin domain